MRHKSGLLEAAADHNMLWLLLVLVVDDVAGGGWRVRMGRAIGKISVQFRAVDYSAAGVSQAAGPSRRSILTLRLRRARRSAAAGPPPCWGAGGTRSSSRSTSSCLRSARSFA